MRNTAFVCPIYDSRNHFDYGINLLNSLIKYEIDSDLIFIFSDEEQKNKFENMSIQSGTETEFKYLILPNDELKYKSQVTVKKFYALKMFKDRYKYIAAIDSETLFIRNENYEKLFDEMWNNRSFMKANISPNGFYIMRDCFKTLGIYENRVLKKETKNYLYNVWFNEIPIYKTDLLNEFFSWLDKLDDAYKNEWKCFEYYIFMAFLIIEKKYKLKKYKLESLGGIMEYLYVFPVDEQKRIVNELCTHWTSSDDCIADFCSIRFHVDRTIEDEEYSSNRFYEVI